MPNLRPIDYGSYTITGTAGTLWSFADGSMPSSNVAQSLSFKGTLETASIRVRSDGVAPTASEGELVNPGDSITLDSSEVGGQWNAIRTGSTSAVLKGHYYNLPAIQVK